jgi:DUF2975 family protein
MAVLEAPRSTTVGGAVAIVKIMIAVAMALVTVFSVAPHVHGSSSAKFSGGILRWSEMGVPVEPTTALNFAHLGDTGPSTNLFPWTDTSDGSRDAATGKPPLEYTFAAPRMYLPAPTPADRLFFGVPALLGDVIVLVVLVLLWRMVGTLRTQVFSSRNARRMVTIGMLIGLGLSATSLLTYFGQVGIVHRSAAAGQLSVPFSFSFVPLLAGAVIVVFAEVFRRGIAMREDLETVV